MQVILSRSLSIVLICTAALASAGDDPIHERHELMEGVGENAKAIGGMLKGERAFDAAVAMEGLLVWREAAGEFGDLFPEGSERGSETKAKITIWTDREGFNERLAVFGERVQAAIDANPQDLEQLKQAAGPVLEACKKCHEGYRVEDD